jgi:crotonobetainyl-CoA:carnitine CoA-transferase CaiB-like acyl-CoA transferase
MGPLEGVRVVEIARIGPAPRFSRTSTSVGRVPGKGEHTQEILRELGKR